MGERRWTVADREPVYEAMHDKLGDASDEAADAVLDALTADGWERRCDCDGVVHDLPILRRHIRGEPGCEWEADRHARPASGGFDNWKRETDA